MRPDVCYMRLRNTIAMWQERLRFSKQSDYFPQSKQLEVISYLKSNMRKDMQKHRRTTMIHKIP